MRRRCGDNGIVGGGGAKAHLFLNLIPIGVSEGRGGLEGYAKRGVGHSTRMGSEPMRVRQHALRHFTVLTMNPSYYLTGITNQVFNWTRGRYREIDGLFRQDLRVHKIPNLVLLVNPVYILSV